jgi:[acyl-carrier-protein] S-malonyltransferase
MGRDLAASFASARRVFEEVDDRLGFALSRLAFDGPAETLALTEHAQPAILAASIAAWRALEETTGLRPRAVAGHSLGEWSALVAAEAVGLADAAEGVRARGRLMQEAVGVGVGAMAAVMGLDLATVEALCAEAADGQVLAPANLNGGGQIVVAGHAAAVDRLVTLAGARRGRAQKLAVSAPFHCALMAPAAEGLATVLAGMRFAAPRLPVVSSVDARPVADAAAIPDLLVRQVRAPVRWEETMRALADGADVVIEVGPGRALAGLAKRVVPELRALAVGDVAGLDAAREALA